MRRRALSVWHIIFFALLAVGIFSWFMSNPLFNIFPLLIFGAVFYFYKFPPGRRSTGRRTTMFASKSNVREKRKQPPFRVIPGNKNNPDDNGPRYH